MAVAVKKDGVVVKDGIAVSIKFIINEIIETRVVMNENGKPFEPPHSRSREDSRQVYIPPADYKQMFHMAGAILGKPRKEEVR